MAPADIAGTVGRTPLVALRHLVPAGRAGVLVKLESHNPTGSMKDRMARFVVEGALASGRLAIGGEVVEYTDGSTGTSLAFACDLRLRQLVLACRVAQSVRALHVELPLRLDVAQLVVVQHAPITLRFRTDETRFDVEGAAGVRFELLKKRLDKACVKGTPERITQPGTVAVVVSTDAEEAEYRQFAAYLVARGLVDGEPELLPVEDLPGATGLRLLRLQVADATG